MVNADIDNRLYGKIRKLVLEDKLRYSSLKFFVQNILLEELEDKDDRS